MISEYKLYFVEHNKKGFCYCERLRDLKALLKDRNILIYAIYKIIDNRQILKLDRGFKNFVKLEYEESLKNDD